MTRQSDNWKEERIDIPISRVDIRKFNPDFDDSSKLENLDSEFFLGYQDGPVWKFRPMSEYVEPQIPNLDFYDIALRLNISMMEIDDYNIGMLCRLDEDFVFYSLSVEDVGSGFDNQTLKRFFTYANGLTQ